MQEVQLLLTDVRIAIDEQKDRLAGRLESLVRRGDALGSRSRTWATELETRSLA